MREMRDYRTYLIQTLRDKEEAIAYLQTALEEYQTDHDTEAFSLALRTVAEAQGGLSELAKRLATDPNELDTTLHGKPQLDTLGTILSGLGFKLSIEPLEGKPLPTHGRTLYRA